jgi:uncharacterized protein (TIGR02391 family)
MIVQIQTFLSEAYLLMPKKSARPKPKIVRQELIAETARRGYELLRLTRVRYQNNPFEFLDLRLFQRGHDYRTDKDVYHPTKKGVQLKEDDFQRLIGKWTLVPSLLFHPLVMKKSYPALAREEFDTAVFRAFKAVEVRVRELSRLPSTLIGVALMRKAFAIDNGPLADNSIPSAEREARSHLFTGAIGCYKNPHSHRDIELTFNESFEMLLVASHLLQILDRIKGGLPTKT